MRFRAEEPAASHNAFALGKMQPTLLTSHHILAFNASLAPAVSTNNPKDQQNYGDQ